MDSGVKEDKEEIIHIPATDTERQEAQTGPQAVAVAAGGGGLRGQAKGRVCTSSVLRGRRGSAET